MVESAATGEDGVWMATEFDFDVVVLDWCLPGMSGLDVCAALRAADRWMSILMLTGNTEVGYRVAGLRGGADDYLTKPFEPEELRARIEAVTRRSPGARPTVLRGGALSLDPATRRVDRGGVVIDLRPKEFSLLELLMRHGGDVLARADILDQIWDMNFDGMSNVVDAHVKALRSKVDKPFGCSSIETVWRVGYRISAA